MQHITIVKVFDDTFASNKTSDPDTFLLVRNELHWLTENLLEKIAIFRSLTKDEQIINILDIRVRFD